MVVNPMNRLLSFVILLLLIAGCQKQSQKPLWNLTHTAPAQIWEECFPLGNGHLGMMPDGGVDEVALLLPIPNKSTDDINDRLNDGLNDRLMATYTIVRSNPGIQRKDISDISGKSIPTIDRHIAILMKKGLIEHRDSKKAGGYYAK